MEKRLHTTWEPILCNCGNQPLLMSGCVCEVCMGLVPETREMVQEEGDELCDQFDQTYFESLERMFESFEFAA